MIESTVAATHPFPSADSSEKSSPPKGETNTLQDAQLKGNRPHLTSLMHRIVKLVAQVAVSLVAIPLMAVAISVSNTLFYSCLLYKNMYDSMIENSKVTRCIMAVTVMPAVSVICALFFGVVGIIDGVWRGIIIAKELSLDQCRDKINIYKNSINKTFDTNF